MKKKRNKSIEKWFYKISPLSKRNTKLMLYALIVINFAVSGFLFTETVDTLEQTSQIAQVSK